MRMDELLQALTIRLHSASSFIINYFTSSSWLAVSSASLRLLAKQERSWLNSSTRTVFFVLLPLMDSLSRNKLELICDGVKQERYGGLVNSGTELGNSRSDSSICQGEGVS